MPEGRPAPISPPAGVIKQESDAVIEGRWKDSQWVRFVDGRPEKMGGYTRQTDSFTDGPPRTLKAWRDLEAYRYIAAGTYKKLYVYEETDWSQTDITPIASQGTLGNNPFTTTSGSRIVSVAHTSHGRSAGDTVRFSGASAAGGITVSGTYTVLTVSSANAYTIQHGSNASSSATGGGASVAYTYEISVGAILGTFGYGYGVGRYGLSTYGTPREDSTVVISPRVWSLDNWGENLLAAFNGGSIYAWDPDDLSGGDRAERISAAPIDVLAMFITEERFVFALCEGMRVDWCHQGDYEDWTPSASNTANSRRLQVGSTLVAGRTLGKTISLVWSDSACYIFQYTGSASVYSSRLAARNCGLLAPNAVAVDSYGNAYWMSHDTFYVYAGGAVREIPNVADIKDFVFKNLRRDYGFVCFAHYDPAIPEIIWYYCVAGESEPTRYVVYSVNDQAWAVGEMTRVSATRFDSGETRPYFGNSDGHIYLHEDGYNADGEAIEAYIELAPYALENGLQIMDIDGLVADFPNQVGNLTISLTGYNRLRQAAIDSQTKTVGETDDLIDLRMSGRHVGLTLNSNEVDGFFRWGKPMALIKPNGMRR